jgi:GNAT superfamily N-acetyltransferase
VSIPSVTFSTSIDGVDWHALKAALAADSFDNGRTPAEYEASARASFGVVFAQDGDRYVGSARILSDGVCNAYVVDVWTATPYRRRGIGSELVRRLLEMVPGQHVALLTDDMQAFYRQLGFEVEPDGMSLVVGTWLNRARPNDRAPGV